MSIICNYDKSRIQSFWKCLSTCDLMEWKIEINWKNESGTFRCYFVNLTSLCQLQTHAIGCIQQLNFFHVIWSRDMMKVLLTTNWKQHESTPTTQHCEHPRSTRRVFGGEENSGYELNLVVNALLEWQREVSLRTSTPPWTRHVTHQHLILS